MILPKEAEFEGNALIINFMAKKADTNLYFGGA